MIQITQPMNKKALMIATLSFLLGTILLLSYIITQWDSIAVVGFFYVLIVIILNAITLIGLVANSIINYHSYRENLQTISLFLLNIPISCGYFFIISNYPFLNLI